MSKWTVTVIDTVGIQDYIFGSNVLKQNVGASELVRRSTQDWVYQELVTLGKTNVNQKGVTNGLAIEHDDLLAELVYAGGGNAVVLFRSPETAREFTCSLSRRALTEAPGLQLIITHGEFNWETEALSKVVQATLEKASRKKHDHAVSAPLLGLGVTADCRYTGLPAVSKNQDGKRVSAEVRAKEAAFDAAHERLKALLAIGGEYDLARDFDHFGREKGVSSYIAVVHTDGNGMGKRVKAIADQYPRPEDNRPYIKAIRAFSQSVREVAEEALRRTYQQLFQSIRNGKIGGEVELLRDRTGKTLIPFRPIVFGGDDVTFVCNGRLGLTLTEFYLQRVTRTDKSLSDGKPLAARAGIVVVKSHFPFARAYALAEELIKSAKDYINERKKSPYNEQDLSAMDWHFAVSGAVLDLDQIRKREYRGEQGSLLMRPVSLKADNTSDWRTWDTFVNIVADFQSDKWAERRNKIKALRDALRDGPEAVKQFRQAYRLPTLYKIPGNPESAKTGWVDDKCTCFDAIEAMEFFVPLEGEAR